MMLQIVISFILLTPCVLGIPEMFMSHMRDVSGLDGRIIGGVNATIKEFPYQVSLQLFGTHICGAAIISNNFVVTAAHCINHNESRYSIRAGSTFRNSGGIIIRVSKITVHPEYDPYFDNDIAVVQLASSLTFSALISPIPLISQNPSAGVTAVVTGWGDVVEGAQTGIDTLQAVTVPIFDHAQCQKLYENHRLSVLSSMICAGYITGGKDACQGDSGGPLAVNGQLVGIVSWGEGCARPNYPGVYSSIAYLRSFVTGITGIQ